MSSPATMRSGPNCFSRISLAEVVSLTPGTETSLVGLSITTMSSSK